MTMRRSGRSLLPLLLLCSVSISALEAAEADDEAALLAFKAAAIRGHSNGDALASWNSSSIGAFCSWEGVTCGSRRRRVVALSLPSQGLAGVLSPAIGSLVHLRTLDLSSNEFTGAIPSSIGRLRRLQALNLSHNSFSGELPANLTSCTSLSLMALQSNQLQGHILAELGEKLTRLKTLILWKNNLTGTIPASLANLSSLSAISLAYNQLEGTIPPGFGGILGLQRLDLAYNHLSGEPPRSLYNLSSLHVLEIQGNRLHGGIPADIGSKFPSISFLSFGMNGFTGTIPTSLSNLTTLQLLDLSENRLSGCMPHALGRLASLQDLYLWGNMLTGTIPASLSNLTTLQTLDLSQNKIGGYVPRTLGRLRNLQYLFLWENKLEANDTEGWEFITSLSNCSQLRQLTIHNNSAFTGKIPGSVVNLSTTLQAIQLSETGISGSIPSAISNLANLQFFSLANTYISGMVPDSIGKLENLVKLGLYNTGLSGIIPSSIGNLSHLTILYAYNGKLEGAIPASFAKLKNLLALDLSKNRLNGSIPKGIFKLPLLSNYLDLSYNSLSGIIPTEVGSLQNLNQLFLSGNQLSGEIPSSIGECAVLQELWLDNNLFEGSIPQSLGNIKGMTELNLSANKLSGTIPEGIGTIHNLQHLYLAYNNLSGPIPTILQNLTSLLELDLSFNNLYGEVPKEGIFRFMTNFSLIGNNELCGGIPQLHLASCHTNYVKRNRKGWLKYLKIALATSGAFLFLAFLVLLIQFISKNLRQKHKSLFRPPTVGDQYERISYQALAKGTNGFSEANLLGKGSFGAVYKCTFQDVGNVVAVKVFNHEQSGSTRSFLAECEALKRVRHRSLIKIITCCSSINHHGHEFKALVLEFMQNGSLNNWLHPKSDITLGNILSLEQRLDIAVDIMDALDYLHNHCQPPVAHCDLKPSNILLAEDMSARVGDFGISRILQESASKILQNSNSTIGIIGSIGYVAPEYGEGFAASTIGDIYSLGIMLLEMFTGRSPIDDMFGDTLDLHKYANQALSENILDIADSTLWLHVESADTIIRSRIEDCLVSVFMLAISCSKQDPKERMAMKDAAVEMRTIRDSYQMFSC